MFLKWSRHEATILKVSNQADQFRNQFLTPSKISLPKHFLSSVSRELHLRNRGLTLQQELLFSTLKFSSRPRAWSAFFDLGMSFLDPQLFFNPTFPCFEQFPRKRPNNGLEFNKTLGKALLLITVGVLLTRHASPVLSQSKAQRLADARSENDQQVASSSKHFSESLGFPQVLQNTRETPSGLEQPSPSNSGKKKENIGNYSFYD